MFLESTDIPVITAFLLGISTAISPCPMATNIMAIGYIGKDVDNRNVIFWNGMLYTLGRVIAYTVLGFIIIPLLKEGISVFNMQNFLGVYGELIMAPVLVLTGLFMLFSHKLNLPSVSIGGAERIGGRLGALLIGMLFAMAFCPTSGVFYFGMLMPMSATVSGGYLLPIVFALATALPVIIVSWILAYSVSGVGKFYAKISKVQKIFNKVVAIVFIAFGLYYLLVNIL